MDDKLDKLLKHALTPSDEPDFRLNQSILNQVKEREDMNKKTVKTMRRMPAAALAAAIVLGCGSVTAFAAWKYLTPQNVAEEFGELKLADAFSKGDAVSINETQSYGGFDVTLMGLISGKDLSKYPEFDDDGRQLDMDKTYTVTAIRKSDGTPMPKTSDDAYSDYSFFVSPLIKGYDPLKFSIMTMHGAYQEFTEDGVFYRITECDNVEMFADHDLYLCVSDDTFYNNEAYTYDKSTGEITRNEAYTGLNALFDLPIDPSKADPEAVKAYIKSLKEEQELDDIRKEGDKEELDKTSKWLEQLTAENIDQYAEVLEDSIQVYKPDKDGYITYSYEDKDRGSFSGKTLVEGYFQKENELVVGGCSGIIEEPEDMMIETLTLNADGTVTFAVYVPKDVK